MLNKNTRTCMTCRFTMEPVICADCTAYDKHMYKGTPTQSDPVAPAMNTKKWCDTCDNSEPGGICKAQKVCRDHAQWQPIAKVTTQQNQSEQTCDGCVSDECADCDSNFSNYATVKQQDPTGKDQHETGAKLDAGKTKWHLLPWCVIEGVAKVMTFGAAKYSQNGWKDVPLAKERYFSAMMRHWMLMEDGEHTDPDSGLPHWSHFVCNAVFLGYFALVAKKS